ncbi:MAG: hypothetical protein HDQ96_02470 [Lachnospiraceae bacterium]|nr:hypothetical protein [Lachnospiraceae bacterium]
MRLLNIDLYQLMNRKKKIVCFGAGKMLLNFIRDYMELEIEKEIVLILDNDTEKDGTQINIRGQKINVISIEKFCRNYPLKDFILLISCADAISVYEQLQLIDNLKDAECCILPFVRGMTNEADERNRYYPENLRVYDNPVIPKVIHYCWFGGKEIPAQNKEWMASWKRYCPDYEIIEWNESNYDVSKNKYMYEAYQAGKWGFVSDYVELDIIYHYGGIYLDTDVEIIKNLDELLYEDAFMGIDGSKNISLGLGFGARTHFRIIKELMDEYDSRSFYNPDGSMNVTAAPTLQISFFNNLGYINNGEYQKIDKLVVYPEKVLSGKCNYTGKISPTKDTFLIHHYDGSWAADEKKNRVKKMHDLYKTIYDKQ